MNCLVEGVEGKKKRRGVVRKDVQHKVVDGFAFGVGILGSMGPKWSGLEIGGSESKFKRGSEVQYSTLVPIRIRWGLHTLNASTRVCAVVRATEGNIRIF